MVMMLLLSLLMSFPVMGNSIYQELKIDATINDPGHPDDHTDALQRQLDFFNNPLNLENPKNTLSTGGTLRIIGYKSEKNTQVVNPDKTLTTTLDPKEGMININ